MTKPAESPAEILSRYADGPSLLDSALAGLSETDLDLTTSADSWSIRQIVHHIADGDDLWKACIKIALGNENGLFLLQWYWDKPQKEWSENWKYSSRGIESSLALLNANRSQIVELIQQIPNAWKKSALLKRPDGQEEHVTVEQIVESQASHLVNHIKDIQAIRQAYNQ